LYSQTKKKHIMKNQNSPSIRIVQGPINHSETLNQVAIHFRTTDFCSRFVSQDFFTINPVNIFWEWQIRFNDKSGWMVIYQDTQRAHTYHIYAYEYENQILMNPTLSFRVDTISRAKQVIPQVVKNLYHEKIQNYGR